MYTARTVSTWRGGNCTKPCCLSQFFLWVCLPLYVQPQVILPGHNPEVYLPERCDGFALNGLRHGVIYSHGHGDRYLPNTDCTVLFSVQPDQTVQFHFEDFILQSQVRGKCMDYVQFFAGDNMDVLTEPLCGQMLPPPLFVNHSQVALTFRTNAKHETRGFKLRFQRTRSLHCKDGDCPLQDRSGGYHSNANTTSNTTGLSSAFLLFPAFVGAMVFWVRFS